MGEQVDREKIGRYQVERLLGKGAMGAVYLARDPLIERDVALKTIRLDSPGFQGKIAESRERFLREAKLTGRLQHPNIVVVYEFGEDAGMLFLAMEYVGGGSLAQRVEREGPFPVGDKLIISAQIAEALAHAHERGVLHRDIKPANILMTPDGHAKVSDFGIGKLATGDVNLTSTGQMIGSPAYMSPEHVRGEKLDSRTDIFSLGVVMYQLFTGVKPFPAESLTTLVYQILNKVPEDPRALNVELPEEISPVILKCLAKDREDRYSEAGEIADALREILARSEDAFSSTLSKRNRASRSGVMRAMAAAPERASKPAADVESTRPPSETEKTQKQPAEPSSPAPDPADRARAMTVKETADAAVTTSPLLSAKEEPEPSVPQSSAPAPEATPSRGPDPLPSGPAAAVPVAPSVPSEPARKEPGPKPPSDAGSSSPPSPPVPAKNEERAGREKAKARFWSLLALAGILGVAGLAFLTRTPGTSEGGTDLASRPHLAPRPSTSGVSAEPASTVSLAPPETATEEARETGAAENPANATPRAKGKQGRADSGPPTPAPTPAQTATPTAVPTPVPDLRISARLGLKLKIEPDQARVFLDGKYIGIADDWDNRGGGELLMFVLPETRRFTLRLAHPGYADLNLEVTIGVRTAEDVVEVKREMVKGTPAGPTGPEGKVPRIDHSTTGKVRIDVKPREAAIVIDGQKIGTAADWLDKELDLDGPAVHEVVVESGEKKKAFRVIVSPTTGSAVATLKARL